MTRTVRNLSGIWGILITPCVMLSKLDGPPGVDMVVCGGGVDIWSLGAAFWRGEGSKRPRHQNPRRTEINGKNEFKMRYKWDIAFKKYLKHHIIGMTTRRLSSTRKIISAPYRQHQEGWQRKNFCSLWCLPPFYLASTCSFLIKSEANMYSDSSFNSNITSFTYFCKENFMRPRTYDICD